MSDYPSAPSFPTGYGAHDQQIPPYLPPTYPNQYIQAQADDSQQGQMAFNYDASMSAYGYNRAIPSFSASAMASGVPPLPIFQGWNQGSTPLPPYTTPSNEPHYPGYTNTAQQPAPYYTPPSQPTYQQQVPQGKAFNQGDLDEGGFEDHSVTTHTPSAIAYNAAQFRENGGTGYTDAAQRAVQFKPKDHSPQQSVYPVNNPNYPLRDSPRNKRKQSGSFSPYVPVVDEQSNEEKYNSYVPNHTKDPSNGTPQSQHGWPANGKGSSRTTRPQTNRHHTSQKVLSQKVDGTSEPAEHRVLSTTNVRSVSDSRKKAQSAILNLWPYEVRYHTYIDEGFSKEVVGSLFDELKMTRNSVKSTSEISVLGGHSAGSNSKQQMGKENIPAASTKGASVGGHPGDKTDRNVLDKERALLGSSAFSANVGGDQTVSSSNLTAASAKPAAMTEKEKTLQSKMEALRKSREERAQKAAAKRVKVLPTASADAQVPQALTSKVPVSNPSTTNSTTSPSPKIVSSVSVAPPQVDSKILTSTSATPVVNVPQQTSKIPGLFFLGNGAGTNLSTNMSASISSTVKKRPVAADFDQPDPISTPFKRPFGHSRADQRLVITVSDDEEDSDDEDVAMELESQATQDSPAQLARKMSDHHSAAIQNIPPLSNFPQRKPYTSPPNSSAANTPPLQSAPDAAGRLTRVQSEMEELKKKIATREARRRAKQAFSGSGTPQASEANGSSPNTATRSMTSIASKVESSLKMQEMLETATTNAAIEQQRLADAQSAEVKKAAELKKSEQEQKRLRREKLAADIPLKDAEVKQSQSKLEQLRAEMALIEANVQKSLADKRLLAEEMERLEREAEDQLEAQKDKLEDINRQDSMVREDSSHPTSSATSTKPSHIVQPDDGQTPTTSVDVQPSAPADPGLMPQVPIVNGNLPSASIIELPVVSKSAVLEGQHMVSSPVEELLMETTAESKEHQEPKESTSTDQALETALQEAVRAEADSHAPEEDEMDTEDFYAPDPNQLAPQTPTKVSREETQETRSPDYSPTIDRSMPDAPGESDDYEPPEATPPIDETFSPESPSFSPAPSQVVFEVANDEDLDVNMPEHEPAPAANDVKQGRSEENLPSTNGSLPQVVEIRPEVVNKPEMFSPYESPLKQFRAYRFHPIFKEDVAGGLKSRTYSHKIDAMQEFCRFELAGGICNDTTCEFQHFRDINLPDDAVLTALGSPEEFKGEQRDRFCTGLRGVLMDLRVRKIRDFEVISSEIIDHRAKFLGDTSKVLAALEGTTI